MERNKVNDRCILLILDEMKEMYSISLSLMELVVNDENLNEAIKRVKANKGAAGVDGMTVQ